MDIKEKITEVFRMTFGDKTIVLSNEMTSQDIEGWDSLSHMIMIERIETEFSIKFKLKDLNKLKNVGALLEMVKIKIEE